MQQKAAFIISRFHLQSRAIHLKRSERRETAAAARRHAMKLPLGISFSANESAQREKKATHQALIPRHVSDRVLCTHV